MPVPCRGCRCAGVMCMICARGVGVPGMCAMCRGVGVPGV